MELFAALLGALLLYYLQDYLYRRYWKKNLSITIELSRDSAIEGEELTLREVIANRKLLPLPILQVKFMTSRFLEFQDNKNAKVSDNYYRNDMVSVLMYQKLMKTLSFHCARRGYYTINRMDVVCSNLFLTLEEVETYHLDIHLYVYPKPVDVKKFEVAFSTMFGTILTRRFINEDPFEFRNIREYQLYDSLKTINWKASAKTDSLKVNVHDYTSSQQVMILINTEEETILKYDDLNEEGIRIASAIAQELIAKGIPVFFYTNARDIITREPITVSAGSGRNHFRTIQEALARIDLSEDPAAFLPGLQQCLSHATQNDYLILISHNQKPKLQALLLEQMHSGKELTWIIPINHDITVTAVDELSDKIIPWMVEG